MADVRVWTLHGVDSCTFVVDIKCYTFDSHKSRLVMQRPVMYAICVNR